MNLYKLHSDPKQLMWDEVVAHMTDISADDIREFLSVTNWEELVSIEEDWDLTHDPDADYGHEDGHDGEPLGPPDFFSTGQSVSMGRTRVTRWTRWTRRLRPN